LLFAEHKQALFFFLSCAAQAWHGTSKRQGVQEARRRGPAVGERRQPSGGINGGLTRRSKFEYGIEQ